MDFFVLLDFNISSITIELVMMVILGLIMITSIITGIVQGSKKNFYLLVSSIIFWILFFILAPIVTARKVWDCDFVFKLVNKVITAEGNNVTELVTNYIISLTKTTITTDLSEVYNLTASIIQCVLKIVFLILFAIVYKIISVIVYGLTVKKHTITSLKKLESYERVIDKRTKLNLEDDKRSIEMKKQIELIKKNRAALKHTRPLGVITGFLRGLIACFISLSIVNSFVLSLPDVNVGNTVTAETEIADETTIYDYIAEKYPSLEIVIDKILDYKQTNLAGVTSFKINGKSADKLFIDGIISGETGNLVFEFRDEFEQICKIVNSACEMTDGFNTDSVNFYSLSDKQVEELRDIILVLSDNSLVTNLLPTAISFASTMESVNKVLPEDFDFTQFDNYDWEEELKNIAYMVEYVYELGDDLSNLDYMNLDPSKVENLINQISKLQCVQTLCNLGSSLAIDSLFKDSDEETISNIKNKLADIAWNDDLTSIGTLYRKFIELEIKEKLEASKKEDGTYDYLLALTSVPTDDFISIIDTLFETTFAEKILPDVMTIVKEKYIPADYRDMINPDVVYTSEWKEELTTVLEIVKEISSNGTDPFTGIKEFSFDKLSNISIQTITGSKILSHAMIQILVTASDGTGILGSSLGKYISVPDELKTYDENEKTYPEKWYGEDGELSIILSQIKNVASEIKDINYFGTSIIPVVSSINPDKLLASDVLYYTVSNLITSYAGKYITIPESVLNTDITTSNGKMLIMRNELVSVLDIATDSEIINLSSILKYYKEDENGNKAYTDYDDLEGYDYKTEILISDTGSLMNILTSKTLYNPEDPDETNLDKLFSSMILRATISCKLPEYTDNFITVPSTDSASSDDYIYDEDNTRTAVKILCVKECKNIIKVVDKLNIDLSAVTSDPLTIISCFGSTDENNNKKFNEELTSTIFTEGSDYSELLHATISKYLKDYSGTELGSGFSIKIPDNVLLGDYIDSVELVNLFSDFYYLNVEELINSSDTDILNCVIENDNLDNLFASKTLKASITGYLVTGSFDVTLPDDTEVFTNESIVYADGNKYNNKVITRNEIISILSSLKTLYTEVLSENPDITYDQLMTFNDVYIYQINNVSKELLKSKIIEATVTSKILESADSSGDFTIVITDDMYTQGSDYFNDTEELTKLFTSITLIIGNQTINTLSSGISKSLSEILDNIIYAMDEGTDVFGSEIFRDSIISYINDNVSFVKIPTEDGEDFIENTLFDGSKTVMTISEKEMHNLFSCISAFRESVNKDKSEKDKLSYSDILDIDNFTVDTIKDTKEAILNSKIMKATLTNYIVTNDAVKVGTDANYTALNGEILYDGQNYIQTKELEKLINSLPVICSGSISDLDVDTDNLFNLSNDDINTLLESEILVNTLSYNIYEAITSNNALYFLNLNKDDSIHGIHGYTARTITREEEKALINAIKVFRTDNESIDEISFDFDTIRSLSNASIMKICTSNIISYNAYKQLAAKNTEIGGCLKLIDNDYPRNWYYDGESYENDDLYLLIKSFKSLYGVNGFKEAFENGLSVANSSLLSNFMTEDFIDLMTGNRILCDSLPNLLSKFTSALDSDLTAYFKTPGQLYCPKKSDFESESKWQEYWSGNDIYYNGELYKLFNGIKQANMAIQYFGASNIVDAVSCISLASSSDILVNTIDFTKLVNDKTAI